MSSIIKQAAMNWPSSDYVTPGETALKSVRKAEMAYEALSSAVQDGLDLVAVMHNTDDPIIITVRSIEAWAKRDRDVKVFESGLELRKVATHAGLEVLQGPYKIDGRSDTL